MATVTQGIALLSRLRLSDLAFNSYTKAKAEEVAGRLNAEKALIYIQMDRPL